MALLDRRGSPCSFCLAAARQGRPVEAAGRNELQQLVKGLMPPTDTVPRLKIFIHTVGLWLQPITDPTVFLTSMGQFFNLFRKKNVGSRLFLDVINDDPEISHYFIQAVTERHRMPLCECLDLNANKLGTCAVIGYNIDSASIPRGWHNIPAQPRKVVTHVVKADVSGDLCF